MIDKTALLQALTDHIQSDLEALLRRQADTQEGATHEENRAEHAKDTRATEEGYLARGLATRAEDVRQTLTLLASLQLQAFTELEAIGSTAIVVTRESDEGLEQSWWLVPAPGAIELLHSGRKIRTLSPASPLGRALIGLHVGDEGSFATPGGVRSFEIIEIA